MQNFVIAKNLIFHFKEAINVSLDEMSHDSPRKNILNTLLPQSFK